MPAPSLSAKLVLLGATGVGKTSIVMRHNGLGFTTQCSPTIGASFSKSELKYDDMGTVELQIWDTAGQERFRAMAPMYYRNANAALAVYDITSRESFNEMTNWLEELEQKLISIPVICVLGNKVDKKSDRVVEEKEGEAWALKTGALFFETSAFTGQSIDKAFRSLGQELLRKNQEGIVVSLDGNGTSLEEETEGNSRKRKCC